MLDRLEDLKGNPDDYLTIDAAVDRFPYILSGRSKQAKRDRIWLACRKKELRHVRLAKRRIVVTEIWLREWQERIQRRSIAIPADDDPLALPPPFPNMTWPTGVIYFVGFGPYVKIGFGKNLERRIGQLQPGAPEKLTIYATAPGCFDQESRLHRRYAEYRTYGEWFRLEGRLRAFVEHLRGKPIDAPDTGESA